MHQDHNRFYPLMLKINGLSKLNKIYVVCLHSGTEIINLKEQIVLPGKEDVSFKLTHQQLVVGRKAKSVGSQWIDLDRESGAVTVKTPIDRERDCSVDNSVKCIIDVTVHK